MREFGHVYLFFRTDLPVPLSELVQHLIVQTVHAAIQAYSILPATGIPNVVAIGVPDLDALQKVEQRCKKHQVTHHCWHEPDGDWGFTSLITAPLFGEQRNPFRNYRSFRFSRLAQLAEHQPLKLDGRRFEACTESHGKTAEGPDVSREVAPDVKENLCCLPAMPL